MRFLLIIFLFTISTTASFCQKDEAEKFIGFFNLRGEECKKEDASYYRKVLKVTEGWLLKEYFINGILSYEGLFENYKKMKGRSGVFTYFDNQGNKLYSLIYKNDNESKFAQVWDADRKEVLTNGNGIKVIKQDDDIQFEYYKDSVKIWSKNFRTVQKDTVYNFAVNSIIPKPVDGITGFREELSNNINYDEFKGTVKTSTRIFAKFIVDETGKVKDFRFYVINSLNNYKIVFLNNIKVSEDYFRKWEAGSVNGKRKQFYFTVPIVVTVE